MLEETAGAAESVSGAEDCSGVDAALVRVAESAEPVFEVVADAVVAGAVLTAGVIGC